MQAPDSKIATKTMRGMGVMANKNTTNFPVIFELPFSWFSVSLTSINIWLFSRLLTKFILTVLLSFFFFFFFMLRWGNCVFEQPTLCAFITLITNFTDTTYMQLASVIFDQPKFLVIFETIKHRFYIFTICTVSSTYFMMHNSLHYQYK